MPTMKNVTTEKLSNEIATNCELLSEQGSTIFEQLPVVKKIKSFFENKTEKKDRAFLNHG